MTVTQQSVLPWWKYKLQKYLVYVTMMNTGLCCMLEHAAQQIPTPTMMATTFSAYVDYAYCMGQYLAGRVALVSPCSLPWGTSYPAPHHSKVDSSHQSPSPTDTPASALVSLTPIGQEWVSASAWQLCRLASPHWCLPLECWPRPSGWPVSHPSVSASCSLVWESPLESLIPFGLSVEFLTSPVCQTPGSDGREFHLLHHTTNSSAQWHTYCSHCQVRPISVSATNNSTTRQWYWCEVSYTN